MRARRGIAAAIAFAAAALAASPARAESRPPGDAGAYVDDKGDPTAVAGDRDDDQLKRPSRGNPTCEWEVVIGDDWKLSVYDESGGRLYSETGRWLVRECRGDTGEGSTGFLVPEGGPADPRQLAGDARKSVPIATPTMSTSPDSGRRLYVRVPTWLWVDEAWWQSYTATATAGRVSSTVTARPVRATWSTGDGDRVTCNGPGVPWREGMGEDATYCRHTYVHSSSGEPDETYTLSVTVELEVVWTSNVGAGGRLAGITRSASRPVEVGEIQAVKSR